MVTIKFAKINECAKIPTKRDEDAGLDIFPCITDTFTIMPNETRLVSTGLICAFDPEWAMLLKERSGYGSKGIGVRAGVIDSGYRGEIKVCLTNHTNDTIVLDPKKAVAQAIFVRVPQYDIEEWEYEDVKSIPSERQECGFGSTDWMAKLP